MAFHFHWSPLIADTDRVRHMLTSSLNKSPKPPIIVDDIVVNELNLGSNPPSLEILEIGDLAEDRFRGIFKVRYEGDAFLTLQTKVQANPLNTFLSSKPGFASPNTLAAGSGLTIPLQITLSDIRLSGFVILVFSKQKGITLVFRNDPLESLKVSSTFDSIPFVRDYLQKTIEGQLRVLFMEDLPAIIHRLSLKVFNDEYQETQSSTLEKGDVSVEKDEDNDNTAINPLASGSESVLNPLFPLDPQGETYATFSQKNLVRLAALSESQRTLSLFTPSIRDTVYRAGGASSSDRHLDGTMSPLHPKHLPTLGRMKSSLNVQLGQANSATRPSLSSRASHISEAPSNATRPSLASVASMNSSYSLGQGRLRSHGNRKRKHRVVNLRRDPADGLSDTMTMSSEYEDSASRSESASISGSTGPTAEMSTVPTSIMHSSMEREGEVHTPQSSPQRKKAGPPPHSPRKEDDDAVLGAESSTLRQRPITPRHTLPHFQPEDNDETPRQSMYLPDKEVTTAATASQQRHPLKRHQSSSNTAHAAKPPPPLPRSSSELSISDLLPSYPFADGSGGSTGGILEQAWMTKMAREIARRVEVERGKGGGQAPYESEDAPPAYVS